MAKRKVAPSDPKRDAHVARMVVDPKILAAALVTDTVVVPGAPVKVDAVLDELRGQCELVAAGDLTRLEDMLVSQAHSLDVLFHQLTGRAIKNMGQYLEAAESYMRLAFRAQSQCRATIETLAAVKNPAPTVIARQANVTSGPQQVNNAASVCARDIKSSPTELSGGSHELLQDARTPAAALGNDSALEAVGEVHRATHARRKGKVLDEPMARRAT